MANLKEVRTRIKSVKSTQQITKAMKMVSAAKLRRAQQRIQQVRPYADKLSRMLSNILSNLEGEANISYGIERDVNRVLMVVVTSDRGLCGAFNSNITKEAVAKIKADYQDVYDAGNLDFLYVGKKGFEYFKKRYPKATHHEDYIGIIGSPEFGPISGLARKLMQDFDTNTYDAIEVAFGSFKNAATQFPAVEKYLPITSLETEESDSNRNSDYVFEPSKDELLETLVPSILEIKFQRYVLDTSASEHGARMTAMDKATENAEEMLDELKIFYNKARQEAITNELSEIVGGAAALESA